MTHRRLASMALAGFTLLSAGCAIVHSTDPRQASSQEGISYMLPKALLQVDLVEADNVLMLRVQPPTLVGDPSQRYLLSHAVNAFASDDLKINVDPATGLLKSLTSNSTDDTLNVLKNAAAALGGRARAESASLENEAILFSGFYDPDGEDERNPGIRSRNEQMIRALEGALKRRMASLSANCASKSTELSCATATRIQTATGSPLVVIKATPLDATSASTLPAVPGTAVSPASPADCHRGICHRAPQPFLVQLRIQDLFEQSTVVQLPNGGTPVVLPIERVAFTTTQHDIGIKDGVVERYEVKHGSAALAVAQAPLDIYSAVLEATAKIIQLRIGANADQVNLAKSQLEREQELKRIADEMAKIRQHGESAPSPDDVPLVSGPKRGGSLLVAEFGIRQITPAKKADGTPRPPQRNTGSNKGANTDQAGQPNDGAMPR